MNLKYLKTYSPMANKQVAHVDIFMKDYHLPIFRNLRNLK